MASTSLDVNDSPQLAAWLGRRAMLMSQIQTSDRAPSTSTPISSSNPQNPLAPRAAEPHTPFKALLRGHKGVARDPKSPQRVSPSAHAAPAELGSHPHRVGERKSSARNAEDCAPFADQDSAIRGRRGEQETHLRDESGEAGADKPSDADLMMDPMARRLAGLACIHGTIPCMMQQTPQTTPPSVHSTADLVYAVVDRFSFGAQGDRAVARLNIAQGPLAGASVTLSSEGRAVALDVSGLSAADEQNLRLRLRESLEKKGLSLES